MERMKKLAVQLRELADRLEKLEIGDVGVDCTINVFGSGLRADQQLTLEMLRAVVAAFAGTDKIIEPVVYNNSTWVRVRNGDINAVIHHNSDIFGYTEVTRLEPVAADASKLIS